MNKRLCAKKYAFIVEIKYNKKAKVQNYTFNLTLLLKPTLKKHRGSNIKQRRRTNDRRRGKKESFIRHNLICLKNI
jgi:hypothetical protein